MGLGRKLNLEKMEKGQGILSYGAKEYFQNDNGYSNNDKENEIQFSINL